MSIFGLIIVLVAIIVSIPSIRKPFLSRPLLMLMKALKITPQISDTERSAIEAGKVGPEQEFFKGNPDYQHLREYRFPELSEEERDFLTGPVEELCKMTDDWELWKKGDLTQEIWDYLKKERFFGMIIPKEYGGLEFSRIAHSRVLIKLASRSLPIGVTVMVPNSLGPAELLLEYGTEEQKNKYLPKLAIGEEIPCFGLTEPHAGSDASSLTSTGVLFRDGEKIKIRLNWKKRWITLGSVATLIGIAFNLKDPDNILGSGENVGITCALVPSNKQGVIANRRHDPLGIPFINSPIEGIDVVVDADNIIGGIDFAGKGWLMLTESLSAGRGISLPSQSTAGAKISTAIATAQASVRHQFGLPLYRFEGVQEHLARISAKTYMIEATKDYALGTMEKDGSLPVISAIVKYNLTEICRDVVNDAMDIMGGAGISMGPRNQIAHAYISQPIGITVEGANILTRTLMIYGQGALRSHPYSYGLLSSIEDSNLEKFDKNFWGFNKHLAKNLLNSFRYFITRGFDHRVHSSKTTRRYYQKLTWSSTRFAAMTDLTILLFGASLKKKEFLTGRLADVLSWQFIALSILRRFEESGEADRDLPLFKWSIENAFYNIQKAWEQIYENYSVPVYGIWKKYVSYSLIRLNSFGKYPNDKLSQNVCDAVLNDSEARTNLVNGIFVSTDTTDPRSYLENAFQKYQETKTYFSKIRHAQKEGTLPKDITGIELFEYANNRAILDKNEVLKITEAYQAMHQAISVDDFEFKKKSKNEYTEIDRELFL